MKIKSSLERLKTGNTRFINDNQNSLRRMHVIDTQKPLASVLTCSDSRIVPELIFDCGIGDLFMIRVAGNIANTSSIASIEYAVAHLDVKLIVVLAHQNCGAVTAAVMEKDCGKNLNHLFSHIKPAINETESPNIDEISKTNAKLTGDELSNRSQIIAKAIKTGNLSVIPAYYSLDSGKVDFFE